MIFSTKEKIQNTLEDYVENKNFKTKKRINKKSLFENE